MLGVRRKFLGKQLISDGRKIVLEAGVTDEVPRLASIFAGNGSV